MWIQHKYALTLPNLFFSIPAAAVHLFSSRRAAPLWPHLLPMHPSETVLAPSAIAGRHQMVTQCALCLWSLHLHLLSSPQRFSVLDCQTSHPHTGLGVWKSSTRRSHSRGAPCASPHSAACGRFVCIVKKHFDVVETRCFRTRFKSFLARCSCSFLPSMFIY